MSEKPSEAKQEQSKEEVKRDFQGLLGSVRAFLSELLEIRSNTDAEATRESILSDIPFKGHTAWILICSIFVASVGLIVNSTAVIIGAMLISPLMGPILGLGLSLAINDIDLTRRSLRNLLVMVVLSVGTAFLFFYVFPIRDESSELLARTEPVITDVIIAFFGGLGLIIARTKKGTIASVIFGVAIATALMPPLCTVGYGLAIGKPWYAAGALYLFVINSIFIALATFLVIKYLRFPMVRYANSRRRRFIARVASLTGLVVMIPAGFTFYRVLQESLFEREAREFLSETVESYQFDSSGVYRSDFTRINYNKGKEPEISLVFIGDEVVPRSVINTWIVRKDQYSRLKDARLEVFQGGEDSEAEAAKYIMELYESKKAELLNKDERIRLLEEELTLMNKATRMQIPFDQISREVKVGYPRLQGMGYSYVIRTNFDKIDTIPLIELSWNPIEDEKLFEEYKSNLTNWIRYKLELDSLQVVHRVVTEVPARAEGKGGAGT